MFLVQGTPGREQLGGRSLAVLGSAGVPQGQIYALVDISQGRLSEWMTGKRKPKLVSTFFTATARPAGERPRNTRPMPPAPSLACSALFRRTGVLRRSRS